MLGDFFMPELPEVETIRRDLMAKVTTKKIQAVAIFQAKSVKNEADFFVSSLVNNSIQNIERVGKLLIFSLQDPNLFLLVHLKMTGKLLYTKKDTHSGGGHTLTSNVKKFPRVSITFEDNSILTFEDMRRFGYLKLVHETELQQVKSKFGIEPLTPNFTFESFEKIFQGRKTPLKALLLNQERISGLGNIYVDEVSFEARVHPGRSVETLNSSEIRALFDACQSIIEKAIEHRGTTFYSYVDATGQKGNYFQLLQVYKRQNLPCIRCQTSIQKIRLAGRGTHFCPTCQK